MRNAMRGVSEAVEKARRKTYGKDAHLTGKAAIEAEYNHRMNISSVKTKSNPTTAERSKHPNYFRTRDEVKHNFAKNKAIENKKK